MRRLLLLGVLLLGVAGSAGAQTTTLLTPSGQPVGGAWQRWLNASYMPTYNGPMMLDTSFDGYCGSATGAMGCTGTAWSVTSPLIETGVTPGAPALERETLLYEQAHVIDDTYLTDADRLELLNLWERRLPAGESVARFWWQGEAVWPGEPPVPVGKSYPWVPVMGEWFAVDYSLCALHRTWDWKLLDRMAGNWPGNGDGYPVWDDARQATLVESGPRKDWHNARLPATRAEAYWLQAQQESCSLIRYWIREATR